MIWMRGVEPPGGYPADDDRPVVFVEVRWLDGYREYFECMEYRASATMLWLKLLPETTQGPRTRHIPLANVRWWEPDFPSFFAFRG